MYTNILSTIVIMSAVAPAITMAGRHSIAREEATKIVENKFAQFYHDEAVRKQAEQQAMEQEILKATDIEAAMLRELEQNAANQNNIKTAEELEQSMQRELADLNHTTSFSTNNSDANNSTAIKSNHSSGSSADNAFFDITSGSKENNPFLFLQDLRRAEPIKRAAGIKEVVESLRSLPDHQKLAEEFDRDLAKISPEMAKEFTAAYKANLTKSTVNATKTVATATPQLTKNHKPRQLGFKESNLKQTFNAVTQYNFSTNKLYQLYTAPDKVTVLVLAPGEKIVGNPICGDSVRWKINASSTTAGITSQHVTIQPLRAGITTSITVATNQGRLYLLEATSLKNNYMAVVRWNYSDDQ